ncbi:hypothetical protein CFC21_020557, partial [Triticum aestivum]
SHSTCPLCRCPAVDARAGPGAVGRTGVAQLPHQRALLRLPG